MKNILIKIKHKFMLIEKIDKTYKYNNIFIIKNGSSF